MGSEASTCVHLPPSTIPILFALELTLSVECSSLLPSSLIHSPPSSADLGLSDHPADVVYCDCVVRLEVLVLLLMNQCKLPVW